MKVLIYARVSTDKQDVDQQADFCKDWAPRNGHEVVWTIKDKESGRLPLSERKRFMKIISDLYNFEYDAVLVSNLDRLTRNWDDVTLIEKFFRENWDRRKLISASDSVELSNASGRFMFRIFMAKNCYMPEDMREKQMIGIARGKKQGKFKGRPKGSKNKAKYTRKKRLSNSATSFSVRVTPISL